MIKKNHFRKLLSLSLFAIYIITILSACSNRREAVVDTSDIPKMNIGAAMPVFLYGDNDYIVLTGTFGILRYSLVQNEVINRISYEELKDYNISLLNAVVSKDGNIIYFGNDDMSGTSLFTYQYNFGKNKIDKLSEQPKDVFKVQSIAAGYDEKYDRYIDYKYLISNTIISMGKSFMYLRANSDWSMKSLELVVCQYNDGSNEVYLIFG